MMDHGWLVLAEKGVLGIKELRRDWQVGYDGPWMVGSGGEGSRVERNRCICQDMISIFQLAGPGHQMPLQY